MLSWVSVVRLLRRRLVLGVIFALSLTYCALSLFQHEKKGILLENEAEDDDELFLSTGKPFFWQMQVLNDNDNVIEDETISSLNGSQVLVETCRNSIQGKALIVDERGLVCARREVLPSGCCSAEGTQAGNLNSKERESSAPGRRERYSCETCNPQGCCAVYEYCVSCCLHPGKAKGKNHRESEMDLIRNQNHRTRKVEESHSGHVNTNANAMRSRLRSLDRFQVCLAACRTSSASVRHENTYKDPHSKHCYNLQPLNINNLHQRYQRDLISINNNNDNPPVVVTPSSAVSFFSFIPLV